tara:strand:+ start:215 stop:478 length:264 start_codon:yes stop_codon:yes gene_type:complete
MKIMARGATLVTDDTAVTGSFLKLQATGTGSACKFDNVTFGLPGKESYGTVYSDVGPFIISGSSSFVEGPIIAFKLVDGACLAYTGD